MKKYIVLKKIGNFSADECRQFEELEKAKLFRDLMVESCDNDYTRYYICEVIE